MSGGRLAASAVLLALAPGADDALVTRSAIVGGRAQADRVGPGAPLGDPNEGRGRGRAFLRGVLSAVLEPKVGLFSTAVAPQFVPGGGDVLAWWALLAGVHVLVGLVRLLASIELVARLCDLIRRRRVRATIEGAAGATMLGFGTAILVEG